ncbi:MAG TPA: LuxR C-terminal-related transcriptional regulator [Vicinamibacterales bacterium]|nr:LuxR C-terminal-related transcriptional regulator [Vicinamibacterales bacterium]
MPVRVFVSGRASDALDALRRRLTADSNLELVDRAELAEAVITLPPDASSPARRGADRDGGLIESLTPREHAVLVLVADGLPNREIAHGLSISEHTVKFHLASIFGKLGVSTRTEAVQRGVRLGVIEI